MGVIARGQTATVEIVARDGDGVAANVTGIACAITGPLGEAIASPAVVHDGVGLYHVAWAVPADADLGTYTATWTGTIAAAAWVAVDLWLVVESAAVITPFTSVEDVRALVASSLSDAQLASVISREEAWLARQITDLAGPRTETFYLGDRGTLYIDPTLVDTRNVWFISDRRGPLGLQRPTDAVSVVDGRDTLADSEVRLLRQGTLVERVAGGWRGPVVTVTSTPNDTDEVRRVVIELVRLTLTETGYASERIGDYSYAKRTETTVATRRALARSLMTHLPAGTTRIPASAEDDRIGSVGAA